MPTGYTAGVQEGTVTEFKDFATTVSRAFGARIMERDNSWDAPYEPRQLEGYYVESFSKAVDKLNELVKVMPEEWADRFEASQQETDKSVEDQNAKRVAEKERYEAMLNKVQLWKPPTDEHVKFKEFMVKQLEESIEFDCKEYTPWEPAEKTVNEYRAAEIASARKNIESYSEQINKQADTVIGNNEWMYQLFRSI